VAWFANQVKGQADPVAIILSGNRAVCKTARTRPSPMFQRMVAVNLVEYNHRIAAEYPAGILLFYQW
jgi:hypothetical protein